MQERAKPMSKSTFNLHSLKPEFGFLDLAYKDLPECLHQV